VSLRARFRDLIIVENPTDLSPSVDEYGDVNDTEDGGNWVAAETVGLIVPGSSIEAGPADRETRTTQFQLFVGPEVDITGRSRVRWQRAEDEEVLAHVVSEPVVHRSARGAASHKVAQLELVED
jgi:hypothetical protein